jgi:hypothetical protein
VSNAKYEVLRVSMDTSVENSFDLSFIHPILVAEKSVIYWTCDTDANNTEISVRFGLNEHRDGDASS